ncbi:type II toxin-antitoxin system prevent-host-death family antitoxin [Halomonas sp. SIMBA_159]
MDVNVHDAKSQLSKLIERALAGEDVVIARRGKPMVRLVPVEQKSTVSDLFGCMRGEIDYIEGWDAPLDNEALAAFCEDNLG